MTKEKYPLANEHHKLMKKMFESEGYKCFIVEDSSIIEFPEKRPTQDFFDAVCFKAFMMMKIKYPELNLIDLLVL